MVAFAVTSVSRAREEASITPASTKRSGRRGGTRSHAGAGALLITKLRPPAPRRDLVSRPGLVEHLATDVGQRLTLVAAPAGWGKTTLLAAWLDGRAHPFAWLSVDRWDNDPARFWTYVVEAIRTVEPDVGDEALALLGARGTRLLERVVPALINDMEPLRDGLTLALDDYHLIESTEVHEGVAFLLESLPATALRLVIATRSDPPLPLPRLRARGELVELRSEELRFSPEETDMFLNEMLGLGLEHDDVVRLHERTEGWAAALYLAALSLRGRADQRSFIAAFAGDDRHVVDYLGAEVLHGQPEEVRTFLLRTSVLDRLSGSLCDAVTETLGSAEMLERIERANLLLVPLDSKRRWYRYHHLFGSLLLHELRQTEPELIPALHRRASAWYRGVGSISEAIDHAIAAADPDGAAELISLHWGAFFNQGRLATVSGWLDALPESTVTGDSRLCVAHAWLALDLGRLDEVEAWIDAAERDLRAGGGKDDVTALRSETAVLRTVYRFKVGDIAGAQEAARETLELAPRDAVFPRTAAGCVLGITSYWSGEADRAIEALEAALGLAHSSGNDLAASYALGYLSVIHADRNDLKAAQELASKALQQSEEPGFAEHFVNMVAHVGRGRTLRQRGDLVGAERDVTRALALGLRGAGRLEIAWAQLVLAEITHARGGGEEARSLLRSARRTLGECPDPGALADLLGDTERRVSRGPRASAPRDSELTERELAVLRLLDSTLTQREIGSELFVSRNTVKTHVRGILRKLDAGSRQEAVERGRALGLL